jgi:hypothetical protein
MSGPAKRQYSKHGLTTLKSAVKKLGARAIDRRTRTGRALAAWGADIVADLGGRDAVSTSQAALIDLAVRTKLMLDSVDAWILAQKTLVNSRKKSLLPVVRERQSLAAHLQSLLKDLGLERKAKQLPSLEEYLRGRARAALPDGPAAATVSAASVVDAEPTGGASEALP